MNLRFAVVLACAMTVAGCGRGGPPAGGGDAASVPTPFVADGPIGEVGEADGGATQVSGLTFARTTTGERLVITFADSTALPARAVPKVAGEFDRARGVVRLRLPATVAATSVTDRFFGADLADRAFVVRSKEGPLFVDLHLRGAAEVGLMARRDPAALVVELRPGGEPLLGPLPVSQRLVLLAPREGEARYPLTIEGYSRTFEANVEAHLLQRGRSVKDTFTTAADYIHTWGEFRLTLPDGPKGPLELQVGEGDAETGRWRGVSVELEVK